MTKLYGPTTRALRYGARLQERATKGEDLGDSLSVDIVYGGTFDGRSEVRLSVWDAGEHNTIADRVLAVRRAIGGRFDKNDPASGSTMDASYAKLTRIEEDYVISIMTERSNTCVRKQIRVDVIEHEATEAWVEQRPVYDWDCEPLNAIVDGREPEQVEA